MGPFAPHEPLVSGVVRSCPVLFGTPQKQRTLYCYKLPYKKSAWLSKCYFGLREKCALNCVSFIPLPLNSRPSSRKSGSALLLLSHRTRSVARCYPHGGLFLRCSLVFGAAFALKILVRFASFRNIWLTEARLDSLAISLNLCAFGIHWILSIFLL